LKLLVDEMYDPEIAEALRALGHDVVHASERAESKSAGDETIFSIAQDERRVIVTNNVRDFMPIVNRALQGDAVFHGIVLTNDKSLPRTKSNTGTIATLLHALLTQQAEDEALPPSIHWLS
jgi:predicted nuclease of predicted toxin-antitoxin system